MKNQKLKLDELKVQSFVTDFAKTQDQTQEVHGGATNAVYCLKNTVVCYYEIPDVIIRTQSWAGCPTDNFDFTSVQDFGVHY